MALSQDNRLITIQSPLGTDALLVRDFTGREGISTLFHFSLEFVSENQDIVFEEIIGKNVSLSLVMDSGEIRYFHGLISRFSQGAGIKNPDGVHHLSSYTAEMVPWLWLLTKTTDSRIFQKLSVPDIIEKIFSEKGFNDYQLRLRSSYEPRDFCVQYQETDFNFISRLMEDEGIFYFFEHEENKHTLVLADSSGEHQPCPHHEEARCHTSGGAVVEEDVITAFNRSQAITFGKYTVNDYNFTMPNANLMVEAASRQSLGPGERECYVHPGDYENHQRGDALANLRMQAEEARITTLQGSSTIRGLRSGFKFTLQDHFRGDLNDKEYVLVTIDHELRQPLPTSSGEETAASYVNAFTCIPFEVPFRPPLITPKPRVLGSQTAIVTGPSGEEIYTDPHGRVKVQFHWDREGQHNENSSCWIRVGQLWAGASWGAMYIPRIGQEVIIEFLEGDPDRPIATGRVYHGVNTPPYPLPDEKNKSTIMSNSTLGGGGYNEIRFDDTKGKEEVYVQAEKDMNSLVKANETLEVGGDRGVHVAGHFKESIDSGEERTVKAGVKETIVGGETRKVNGGVSETINGGETRTVNGGQTETVNGSLNQTVSSDINVTTPAAYSLTATGGAKITAPAGVTIVAPGGHTQVDSFWDQTGLKKFTAYAVVISAAGQVGQTFGQRMLVGGWDTQLVAFKVSTTGVVMDQKGVEVFKKGSSLGQKALCAVTFGFYSIM
jgi:type VI secretion system secreted protein VgrG